MAELKWCMDQASSVVLDGFVLGVDGCDKTIVYPNRFIDEEGGAFWNEIKPSLVKYGATWLESEP